MVEPKRKHSTAVVFETIDFNELKDLSDPNRRWLEICLGCEYVDLTDSGKTLTKLFELFPPGTTTRDNIEDLLFEITTE